LGGIAGYFISFWSENIIKYLLPLAAGGFIYIASADLIPEIKKELSLRKSAVSFAIFLLGIIIIFAAKLID
jgi:zinc and cadmium transporter